MNLKRKILLIAIFPTLFLGIVILTLTLTVMKGTMIDEVEESLRGAATATNAAYNVYSGEFVMSPTGEVWKGSFNASKSTVIVDRIKEHSRMDVVVFFGTDSIMTSLTDENEQRLQLTMEEEAAQKLLVDNEENKGLFARDIRIQDEVYYGYYSPLLSLRKTLSVQF